MTGLGDSATYLGVDLGTSGLKLVLLDAAGHVVGETEAAYRVHADQPGFAETDPADWAVALSTAGQELVARVGELAGVAAIGVTGQMHGVVLADGAGRPVRPAVLWPDQRAATVLEAWRALPAQTQDRLANPLVAGMAGPILSWLGAHEPDSLDAADLVCSPKDWVRARLTADRATDRSDASATLLWDLVADDWSPAALRLAGLRAEQLPEVVASDRVVGTTGPEAGGFLPVGRPVVAGGGDTPCALAALQAGADDPEPLVVNVGTGIQVLRPSRSVGAPGVPGTHLYADTTGGWYRMLAIQNGGLALSWVQAQLGVDWAGLLQLARSAPAGSSGVVFVPFLTGERGGVAAPAATASWRHLRSDVGRAELARAAFEAMAFTIRRGLELLDDTGAGVLLSGGGSREPWVRQLVADAVGRPLRHVRLRSASAVGAARLAARGVGHLLPVPATVSEVVPEAAGALEEAYRRWCTAVEEDVDRGPAPA